MVAVLIFAGVRREELLWLTHDDLDLSAGANGVIRIRAKTIDGESWQPKTKKNRAVPISFRLKTYLERWRFRHRKGPWLFPSPQGKRWDPDNFSQDLRAANEKANLPWGSLDFRHTFGSQLAMKGESLYKISMLLGNSPEICRRHYAALVPEALCDTVEFGEPLLPASTPPPIMSADKESEMRNLPRKVIDVTKAFVLTCVLEAPQLGVRYGFFCSGTEESRRRLSKWINVQRWHGDPELAFLAAAQELEAEGKLIITPIDLADFLMQVPRHLSNGARSGTRRRPGSVSLN
jgi:hypothetical protein